MSSTAPRIKESAFQTQVFLCRVLCLLLLILTLIYRANIDHHINNIYRDYLLPSSVFNFESFEPLLSVLCFAINLPVWKAIDTWEWYFSLNKVLFNGM